MNATTETDVAQVTFKERELQELFRTLEQVQDQIDDASKVRFLRLLASQAEAYAVRIEAHE